MCPSIIFLLIPLFARQHLKRPPPFRHLQLVVYWRQRIQHILFFLIDEWLIMLHSLLVVLGVIQGRVESGGEAVGRVMHEWGTGEDMRVEGFWV